jgi:ABC-2 type transport system ATP-binding protein
VEALSSAVTNVDPSLRVTEQSEPDAEGFRRITLTTSRDDELGETLLRALVAQNLRVRALARAHPTLEDVFLAATRRSWDAVAPLPAAGSETGSQKSA